MAVIPFHKYPGETLATMLVRFRGEFPEFKNSKVTYAGRLDPMASGLMILLTDNDVHRKEDFLGLDKVYEVVFFCGIQTDTYDVLGKIIETQNFNISESKVHQAVMDISKVTEQTYPPYSSRTVKGKPLWMWEREGLLDTIDIPKKSIEIFNVEFLGSEKISIENLSSQIYTTINQVEGDFRQQEIIDSWQRYFTEIHSDRVLYRMRIHASSGSYMRGLVDMIGKQLGTGATTLSIIRTKLGGY